MNRGSRHFFVEAQILTRCRVKKRLFCDKMGDSQQNHHKTASFRSIPYFFWLRVLLWYALDIVTSSPNQSGGQ